MTTEKYASLFPHVAPRSKELLHILVHGAASLPVIGKREPCSYVAVQNEKTMKTQDIGDVVNATNAVEGISPHWNEMIYAKISEDDNHFEEITIYIIDEPRNLRIARYTFPWRWFTPYYQYHLKLKIESNNTNQPTYIYLYVSIMRKQSSLSKEDIRYFGLEVLLNGFDVPMPTKQSMYAVTRIVSDYPAYREDYLRNEENKKVGIEFKTVVYPNDQDFAIPDFTDGGYPQLSIACKESKIPVWKHDFLFSHENEKSNMFTSRNSAVVIEFYPFEPISNNSNWRIRGLLGYTAIQLNSRTYDALASSSASNGMRTEGLVIESEGDLTGDNSKYLTVEVILRLVTERHPAKNLLLLSNNNLSVLPSYNDQASRQKHIEPVYLQTAVQKSFLPAIQPPVPPIARSPAPVRKFLFVFLDLSLALILKLIVITTEVYTIAIKKCFRSPTPESQTNT